MQPGIYLQNLEGQRTKSGGRNQRSYVIRRCLPVEEAATQQFFDDDRQKVLTKETSRLKIGVVVSVVGGLQCKTLF